MSVLNLFFIEIRKFVSSNGWLIAVYFGLVFLIHSLDEGDFSRVLCISSLHFISDIFIMMMFSAYARGEYRIGTWFQILSFLLFLFLKLNTGLVENEWHYLAADPIYFLAALKNYLLDVKRVNLKWVNPITTGILGILIVVLFYYYNSSSTDIWQSSGERILSFGIFLFAMALTITRDEMLRSYVSIIALTSMVLGSALELYNSIIDKINPVSGLELSYVVLPLTVLIYYVKNLNLRELFLKSN
ncbi:hypothetical protein [Reichenbachiella sp.]|uniref:hypothetical protein n=1 Tax=Reichenbachiella sp. TaxID=2184521 RepID=UPI003B5B71E6